MTVDSKLSIGTPKTLLWRFLEDPSNASIGVCHVGNDEDCARDGQGRNKYNREDCSMRRCLKVEFYEQNCKPRDHDREEWTRQPFRVGGASQPGPRALLHKLADESDDRACRTDQQLDAGFTIV